MIHSGQINVMGDVSDGAESLNVQIGSVTDRKNGSARATVRFLPATSDWLEVNHPEREVGNRDASLLFDDHDNGAVGQRG